MPDILAIISKPIFEEQAKKGGKLLGPGAVLSIERYVSKNKALAPLAQGGRLVLFTVRPPNEQLWLVAILEDLTSTGTEWVARAPNTVPITDVSRLRKTIKLATGKGLSQEKGTLGMSLQTPRALAPEDVEALMAAVASKQETQQDVMALLPPEASPSLVALAEELKNKPDDDLARERFARALKEAGALKSAESALSSVKHLNAHESGAPLPCLCAICILSSPLELSLDGMAFTRDFVVKRGRVLHFWAPVEVLAMGSSAITSMRSSLSRQLKNLDKERKARARAATERRALEFRKKTKKTRRR